MFEACAFVSPSGTVSPASRASVARYAACGPVIGSSPVTHSSVGFSGDRFGVSPALRVMIPVTDYEVRGYAAHGNGLKEVGAGVYFGIGAAFAFHAGEVSQAPAFFQKNGLEWAYRLCAEPRRLFKRYFTYNSLFLWYLLNGG